MSSFYSNSAFRLRVYKGYFEYIRPAMTTHLIENWRSRALVNSVPSSSFVRGKHIRSPLVRQVNIESVLYNKHVPAFTEALRSFSHSAVRYLSPPEYVLIRQPSSIHRLALNKFLLPGDRFRWHRHLTGNIRRFLAQPNRLSVIPLIDPTRLASRTATARQRLSKYGSRSWLRTEEYASLFSPIYQVL